MFKNEKLFNLIFELWNHLSIKRKQQFFVLFIFMIITGVFELLTIGLVMPFLYLLQNPEYAQGNNQEVIGFINLIDTSNIFAVSSVFIFVIASLGILKLFVLWYVGELTARIGADLGSKAYRNVLTQPYSFHLKSNSSNLITTINGHTDQCVGALVALLQLFTAIVVFVFIITGLILINPQGALLALIIFTLLYLLIGF